MEVRIKIYYLQNMHTVPFKVLYAYLIQILGLRALC